MRRQNGYQGHGQGRGRRGGGGGGGGFSGEDNIGNRKRPEDQERHVAEDIGNRKVGDDHASDAPDDIGNRVGGPPPWSRSFLKGKATKGRFGKVRGGNLKEMESLYSAQGDGVPKHLRPGFRALATGEVAQMVEGGELRPTGMLINGDRIPGSTSTYSIPSSTPHQHRAPAPPRDNGVEAGDQGLGAPDGAYDGPDGMEGDETGEGGRRKRRRRRKKGGREGMLGPDGLPLPPQPQSQQHLAPQGGGHASHNQGPQVGFEDEDEGFRYQLKSDPEDKRTAALAATLEVLKHAGRPAATASALVIQEPHGPRVVVEITDKAPDGALFGRQTAALSALTFLVNKIINRYPDDRIRLSIVEAGSWVAGPTVAAGAPAVPAVAPAAAAPVAAAPVPVVAPAAAAVAAPAPVAPAPAPVAVVKAAAPAPAPVAAAEEEAEEEEEEEEGDEDAEDGEEDAGEADSEKAPARKAAPKKAAAKGSTAAKKTTAPRRTTAAGVAKKAAPKRAATKSTKDK